MFPFRLLKEVKEVATWSSPFLCETNLFLDEKTRKHLDIIKFVRQAAKSPFLYKKHRTSLRRSLSGHSTLAGKKIFLVKIEVLSSLPPAKSGRACHDNPKSWYFYQMPNMYTCIAYLTEIRKFCSKKPGS